MEAQDSSVYGCGRAETWTRMVGWSQAVGIGLGIVEVLGFALYFGVLVVLEEEESRIISIPLLNEPAVDFWTIGNVFIVSAALLSFLVLALLAAVFLLVGSYKKKPGMITAWTLMTSFLVGIWICRKLRQLWHVGSALEFFSTLALNMLWLGVFVFLASVVAMHREDIKSNLLNQARRLTTTS